MINSFVQGHDCVARMWLCADGKASKASGFPLATLRPAATPAWLSWVFSGDFCSPSVSAEIFFVSTCNIYHKNRRQHSPWAPEQEAGQLGKKGELSSRKGLVQPAQRKLRGQ